MPAPAVVPEEPRARSVFARYGVAVAMAGVALLLTVAARDLLSGSVFLLFFPAVIGAAWFGGFGPSVLVVAAAVLTANVTYLPPVGVLSLPVPRDSVWLALSAAVATTVGWITARQVEAKRYADAARRHQESLARELADSAVELSARAAEAERLLADLKETNTALERSELRFRAMADNAPVLIWESDAEGGYTYFNEPWLSFTGRTAGQEMGDGWTAGIHPDDRERWQRTFRAAFAARMPFRMEYRLRRHDGEYRWLLDVGTPRHDPDGTVSGYIGSCIDVQEDVEAEQRLREGAQQMEELTLEQEQMVEELQARTVDAENARAEAQLANQAKSRFLAVMSHELRTPLNAILGYADLLAGGVDGEINAVQAKHVGRIRDSVMHLRDLIDQILSLSRIEAGREELNFTEFDLTDLLRSTVAMLLPQASRRQLTLEQQLPDEPLPVLGDERKVRQVVLNLLSNAVKFTDQGGVLVEAVEAGEAMVCISVRDTGVGIGEADLKRIFEPFTQVDQSMTRRAAGTGLGLSVSRQLAELMGGTLTVSSTPGRGSTFRFTLPLDGVARAHVPPKVERRLNPPGPVV